MQIAKRKMQNEGQTGFHGPFPYTALVRKRLVIGAMAGVVMGVAVYVLSQPKEGTVAWHKKEYLRAQEERAGRTLSKKAKRLIERLRVSIGFARKPTMLTPSRPRDGELKKHQSALIQFGFLEEKTVRVSRPLGGKVDRILDETSAIIPKKRRQFAQLSPAPVLTVPSFVTIVAPPEDIVIWEDLIRKADGKASPEVRQTTNRSLLFKTPGELPVSAGLDEMLSERPDVRRSAQ